MKSSSLVYLVHVRSTLDLPERDNPSLRNALEHALDQEAIKRLLGREGKITHLTGCYSASFWLHGVPDPQPLLDHLQETLRNGALLNTPFYGHPVTLRLHAVNPEALATMDTHHARRPY